jgi:hypothetical protein
MDTVASRFDLAGCLTAAAAIEDELSQLTTGLSEAQFHAPTRTGGWSMGYCIEHLVLTGKAFLPKWDMALSEAVATKLNGNAPFEYAWWQRRILQYAEDSSKLKHKTASCFVPYSRHSIEETAGRFIDMHQQLVRRVLQSRGLDVMRTKVQSPFISWIRYPLGFSFDLALAHERRHLRQAWRVRRQLADTF